MGKIIDLTLEMEDGLQTFSSHPRMVVLNHVTHEFTAPRYIDPCKGFASKMLIFSDHAGTHVDAQNHYVEGGECAAKIPIEKLIGKAVCIDVSNKEKNDVVDSAMLERVCQENYLNIEQESIVLIRTFPGSWGEDNFFEWQGINDDAAAWLQSKKVKAVGVDLPIADEVGNMQRPVHMRMLKSNIYLIENLINLHIVANQTFTFIGLPLKIKGATGSPIRAVAVLND
ncbi:MULTISPECIES: cyclase family protein [unclassified Thermoactinomyces]|uniref:cyclase family protein n=1 Tax=unclassified Thermoactinomyces TaxID=2634588 RepID=UPI0018DE6FCD|nr:cyclase family protein [Thermoactinomyces sp. CICC 10523]MBH8608014.1 cyclase family protein [Thermoactinomyces sp. CICC 10521]